MKIKAKLTKKQIITLIPKVFGTPIFYNIGKKFFLRYTHSKKLLEHPDFNVLNCS